MESARKPWFLIFFDVGYCHFQCFIDTLMYLLEHYKYTLHIFTSPYGIEKMSLKGITLSYVFEVFKSFQLHLFFDPHVMFNKYLVLFLSLSFYYLIKWITMFYMIIDYLNYVL